MNLQRLAVLQWVGLLVGALAWTTVHLAGIGITQAECNSTGQTRWHLSTPAWEGTVLGISALCVLIAGVCSAIVFFRTRGFEFGDGPPEEGIKGERKPTRIHFFAASAFASNAIFLMIILLEFAAQFGNIACRQS